MRKQTSITDRQRIDTNSTRRPKIKNQPVCSTSHFNHTSIRLNRLKRLQQFAHTRGRSLHRRNHFLFVSANVLRLTLLVGELTLKRPPSKFLPGLFPPTHFAAFAPFCG